LTDAPATASRGGPLTGLRVVDLTTVMMGPLATQILGDLGADVIKVESFVGDSTRRVPPDPYGGLSGISLNLNRNKRSIAVDLKRAEGRRVVLDLLATADVLVTNMRRGALRHLGFGYDDIGPAHPRLVYCAANGFRDGSPYADRAAYDDVIQAATGVVDLTRRLTGTPSYAPMVLADKLCGLTIVYSVQAALLEREHSGLGQFVEVPMADVMVAFNLVENLASRTFEPPLGGTGYARSLSPSRKPWRTSDGWICLLPYTDANWRDFFAFTDCPQAADDPRWATFASRTENIDELYALGDQLCGSRSTAEWLQYASAKSIPVSEVLDLDHVVDDEYFAEILPVRRHPVAGAYHLIAHPVRYSRTPWSLGRHCPTVGEDAEEVLAGLGMTPQEIAAVTAAGAVMAPAQGPPPGTAAKAHRESASPEALRKIKSN
jgi:crotonobetainyl-CoA:carnitine CoA-transferase CaiB-like acyl-CoA transferase